MKKVFLLLGLIGIFTVTSCKKDYNCICNYEEEHEDHHDDEQQTKKIEKAKEDDAQAECDALKAEIEMDDDVQNVQCELK